MGTNNQNKLAMFPNRQYKIIKPFPLSNFTFQFNRKYEICLPYEGMIFARKLGKLEL